MVGLKATDCISLRIGDSLFKPKYCQAIFGDSGLIYGYESIRILINWDPVNLIAYHAMQWTLDENEPDQPCVRTLMSSFLESKRTFTSITKYRKAATRTDPMLKMVVWSDEELQVLAPPSNKAMQYFKCVQIMSLFYIKNASYINEDDTKWRILFIRDAKTRVIMGFCIVYSFLYYKYGSDYERGWKRQHTSPRRDRIGQMLIFPPFQHIGVGLRFYKAVMSLLARDVNVKEITIEDPNEEFTRIRDRGDLEVLSGEDEFHRQLHRLPTKYERIELARRNKITERQILKCRELLLLKTEKTVTDQLKRLVKLRLWEEHYSVYQKLSEQEQQEAMEAGCQEVLAHHKKVLKMTK